jgi:molecular chaperone GrpE
MNSNQNKEELLQEEYEIESNSSLDDFMRELEEKERSLSISNDQVVEVEAYEEYGKTTNEEFYAYQPAKQNIGQTGKLIQSPDVKSDELKNKLSEMQKERDELVESLRRRKHEFENFRNRTERERSETFQQVLSSMAKQIIPVVDNLNRALDSVQDLENRSADFTQFFEGIVLVSQQLHDVLGEMGVKPIASVGYPFDPHFHEAVATEKSENFPPQTVIEELLRGYRLGTKIIRPTMVKVSA